MEIDGAKPLEPPPYGDNIFADAKNRVDRDAIKVGASGVNLKIIRE